MLSMILLKSMIIFISSPYRSHEAKCNIYILFLNFFAKKYTINYLRYKQFKFFTTGMKWDDIDF